MNSIRDDLTKITNIYFSENHDVNYMMRYLQKEGLLDTKTLIKIVSMLCDRIDKIENDRPVIVPDAPVGMVSDLPEITPLENKPKKLNKRKTKK